MKALKISVEFEEVEARLLSQIVSDALPGLSEREAEVTSGIAGKFLLAAAEAKQTLIDELGEEGAEAWAAEQLRREPLPRDS